MFVASVVSASSCSQTLYKDINSLKDTGICRERSPPTDSSSVGLFTLGSNSRSAVITLLLLKGLALVVASSGDVDKAQTKLD